MADYRDPKVTTTGVKRESNTSKWIGIAVAVLVVLLLIAWFTGAFDGGGGDVAPVVEQPATEGTVAPTTEGTTAPATEGTAPATEPATPPAQQ